MVFTAEPGALARFGAVEIVGQQSVGEQVIRRQARLPGGGAVPPEPRAGLPAHALRPGALPVRQHRDRSIPRSRSRRCGRASPSSKGRHQRVNFGVGYGTEDKGRVQGDYRHVNFLGGARTAGVQGRWSSLDRGVRASFNQPYVFAPHFSAGLEGQQWRTVTPAYESRVSGGRTTLTHRANPALGVGRVVRQRVHQQLDLGGGAERSRRSCDDLIALGLDPTTGRQEGTLNAVAFDFNHSTTNNLLDARRGYQVGVHVRRRRDRCCQARSTSRPSPSTRGTSSRWANASWWPTRLQAGNINPNADDPGNVPFSKKYSPRRLDEHPRAGAATR